MAMSSELSELARQLSAARRRVQRTCEVCGTEIEGIARRRYCSGACTQRAYRARLGEEYQRRERERYRRKRALAKSTDRGADSTASDSQADSQPLGR